MDFTDVIEKAVLSKDVDGPLYDLLKCLIQAVFKMQDEEEEDEKLDLEEHGVTPPTGTINNMLLCQKMLTKMLSSNYFPLWMTITNQGYSFIRAGEKNPPKKQSHSQSGSLTVGKSSKGQTN